MSDLKSERTLANERKSRKQLHLASQHSMELATNAPINNNEDLRVVAERSLNEAARTPMSHEKR